MNIALAGITQNITHTNTCSSIVNLAILTKVSYSVVFVLKFLIKAYYNTDANKSKPCITYVGLWCTTTMIICDQIWENRP